MRDKILQAYAHWVVKNAKAIAIGAFLVSGLALTISLLFLKTQTGILDLYSKDQPVARYFLEFTEKFGAVETLVLVFEGADESQRRAAIQALATRLEKGPQNIIRDILYKIDLKLFKEHAFQFFSEAEARDLLKQVQSPHGGLRMFFTAQDFNDYLSYLNRSIERGMKRPRIPQKDSAENFSKALAPLVSLKDFMVGLDLSSEALTTRLQGEAKRKGSVDDEGYLRTDDKKMHIMLLRPTDRKQDYRVAKKLVRYVRNEVSQVRQQFPEVTIGVTGGPALNNDQFEISEKDMTLASIFAFFSTGIIFVLAFKAFARPFLGLLTLALSLSWAFGLTALTIGHLNMFSLAFVVILVGQGTYYGVHVVSRYEEELIKGLPIPRAIENTITHIFGNITTSTITTASAFFATTLVELKGFAELGWIAGSGILLSSLGMQMVLPAFLLIYDRKGPRFIKPRKKTPILGQWLQKKWVGFARSLVTRRAPYLIVLVVGLALWGTYLFFSPKHGIPFDSNLLNLQAKGTEAVRYEKKLIETSLSPRAGIFLTDSLSEAQRIVDQTKGLASVQRVEWIGDTLPEGSIKGSTHAQLRRSINRLNQGTLREPDISKLQKELARLKKNLEKVSEMALAYADGEKLLTATDNGIETIEKLLALAEADIKRKEQERSIKDCQTDKRHSLTDTRHSRGGGNPGVPPTPLDSRLRGNDEKKASSCPVSREPYFLEKISEFQTRFFPAVREMFLAAANAKKLELKDVPPEIVSRFLSPDNTYAIYAFPSVNIWEREPLEAFVEDLKEVDNKVTGPPVMFYEVLNVIRSNYFKAASLSALTIFIIFLIDFRSLRYALLASLPLVLGTFCLFGLMSFFNLSFNTANMIALPMILGIGADNGVHMIHRFREEKEASIEFLFRSTGKALLITYLDTLTSFVGLAFANHQGLAQLGKIVMIGITCCTFCGILFLPSVMVLVMKNRKKKAHT